MAKFIVERDIDAPRRKFPDVVSHDLEAILIKALARAASKRYPSVSALADDLQRVVRREPVGAKPATTGYLLRTIVARHRIAIALIAIVLTAAVTTLMVSLLQKESTPSSDVPSTSPSAQAPNTTYAETHALNAAALDLAPAFDQGPTAARLTLALSLDQFLDPERRRAADGDAEVRAELGRTLITLGQLYTDLYHAGVSDGAQAANAWRDALALLHDAPPATIAQLQAKLGRVLLAQGARQQSNEMFDKSVKALLTQPSDAALLSHVYLDRAADALPDVDKASPHLQWPTGLRTFVDDRITPESLVPRTRLATLRAKISPAEHRHDLLIKAYEANVADLQQAMVEHSTRLAWIDALAHNHHQLALVWGASSQAKEHFTIAAQLMEHRVNTDPLHLAHRTTLISLQLEYAQYLLGDTRHAKSAEIRANAALKHVDALQAQLKKPALLGALSASRRGTLIKFISLERARTQHILGVSLIYQGQHGAAQEALNKAQQALGARQDPEALRVQATLTLDGARLSHAQGRFDEALTKLDRVLQKSGDDATMRIEALLLQANAFRNRLLFPHAKRTLDQAQTFVNNQSVFDQLTSARLHLRIQTQRVQLARVHHPAPVPTAEPGFFADTTYQKDAHTEAMRLTLLLCELELQLELGNTLQSTQILKKIADARRLFKARFGALDPDTERQLLVLRGRLRRDQPGTTTAALKNALADHAEAAELARQRRAHVPSFEHGHQLVEALLHLSLSQRAAASNVLDGDDNANKTRREALQVIASLLKPAQGLAPDTQTLLNPLHARLLLETWRYNRRLEQADPDMLKQAVDVIDSTVAAADAVATTDADRVIALRPLQTTLCIERLPDALPKGDASELCALVKHCDTLLQAVPAYALTSNDIQAASQRLSVLLPKCSTP